MTRPATAYQWRRGETIYDKVPGAVALEQAWKAAQSGNWEAVTAWSLVTMAESMVEGRGWQREEKK